MTIEINGSGTITGISAGGLPDNCITAADLATTLDLSSNTVTLPSGTGGKILQVKSTTKTGTQAYTSTNGTVVDITDLSLNITPSASGNKILIAGFVSAGGAGDTNFNLHIYADGSEVGQADAAGNRRRAHSGYGYQNESYFNYGIMPLPFNYLYTTTGTSEITIKVAMSQGDDTNRSLYVNYSWYDTNDVFINRQVSTLTIMEVAA